MALKDRIAFGMSLPHRSPDAIDVQAVRAVAKRAEALGFRDLWVTENTLDHVTCLDPVVVLTYAGDQPHSARCVGGGVGDPQPVAWRTNGRRSTTSATGARQIEGMLGSITHL